MPNTPISGPGTTPNTAVIASTIFPIGGAGKPTTTAAILKAYIATVGTVVPDPTLYPNTGNTLDVFANRAAGNLQDLKGAYTLPVVTGLNNKIVADGNSNGVGYNLPAGNDYPTLAYNSLGGASSGYSKVNFSVAGQTTVDMIADAATQVDPAYDGTKSKNYLFAWEIENDVFVNGASAATAKAHMATYYSGRKAVGYKVIGATSSKRGVDPVINKTIADANALLLADPTSYDYIVDIPSIPMLSNNISMLGYQTDFTHYTLSGVNSLADAYVTKVRTDLGQTDYIPFRTASWGGNTPDRAMLLGATNNNGVGFITNGKIRGEFRPEGTFATVPEVTAASGVGVGTFLSGGLTAAANSDVLSVVTIQPSYYYDAGFSTVVHDILKVKNSSGTDQLRIDEVGQLIRAGGHTARNSTDGATNFAGSYTGLSTNAFYNVGATSSFTYSGNGQIFQSIKVSPSALTRGAFVTTKHYGINIDMTSGSTIDDRGINISGAAGSLIYASGNTNGGSGMTVETTNGGTSAYAYTNYTSTGGISTIGRYPSNYSFAPFINSLVLREDVGDVAIYTAGDNSHFKQGGILNVASKVYIGSVSTAPTAKLHLAAGSTSASSAPIKLTSGTNMTTAEAGAMEYNGTNLFFTRAGTTRENVVCSVQVNSVSPTAPNRTVQVVLDGTTYYLAAKTTND